MCISETEKGEIKKKKKQATLLRYYTWSLKWESKNDRIKQNTGIWKEKKWGQENKPQAAKESNTWTGTAVTLLMLKCSITNFAHISLLLSFVCLASKPWACRDKLGKKSAVRALLSTRYWLAGTEGALPPSPRTHWPPHLQVTVCRWSCQTQRISWEMENLA